MVGSSVIWAAAAAVTAVRLAEGSPYGSWVHSYCQETSMDIVFAIDDALASDGSLQDLFDGEAAASLAATADVEDPHFALVKFNKPLKGCSATGALLDELETCASISTSVYDTDQFVDVARQALAPATATAAEDIDRANDATFGVVAAAATGFRANTFRVVSVFSSVRASAPDPITSPCAAYTGEKIYVAYYTPYCGSSYYFSTVAIRTYLLVNHAVPLIYVASDDIDTIATWEEVREFFALTFELPLKTGVSKEDYVATALTDIYAYRELKKCTGPWEDWSCYSIARASPVVGVTTSLMLLLDDAVVTHEILDSIPDGVDVQALRFNKQMGNCLPNPSPNGLFDRPDRDGCHMEFLGQRGLDGQNVQFNGAYSSVPDLRRFLDEGDLEGEVFGGARAGDLVNALYASAILHMNTIGGSSRSEKIVVLYTGLQPFASHTPCPSTSDQGGTFTPEDGVQGFNILCTGQKSGGYLDAIREITGKGAHLLVVIPPYLEYAEDLRTNWNLEFFYQKFVAYDGGQRQVYIHVGGVVDGIEELRKRV